MFDASGHNKNLAGVNGDGAISQFDVERTLEHQKKIIRVIMLMPVEWALELGNHNVVAVVCGNC
jgi:hypothetical protein